MKILSQRTGFTLIACSAYFYLNYPGYLSLHVFNFLRCYYT